ncbi:MAG TPA: NDP-sugar synthase [Pyrinomonadaceae bacterium]|nr:NDP-sugar synthase [Pyrinomonadaceae bacterium]HMP66447.1 NDP-sugar synthase [Pyrinomonadaceae bacterium]
MKELLTAIILAGGKGTRLRPLTVYTPKPIVPFVNRPFLLYQLDILGRADVRNVTLSLNYQPNKIEDVMGAILDQSVALNFVTEPNPLGTAGAVRYAAGDLHGTYVVLNGDILTDLALSDVIRDHRSKKADATIVLKKVEDPSRYGLVETDESGRVLRFLEKPSSSEVVELDLNTINAGIYILEKDVLELIAEDEPSSFEYDIFPAILKKGLVFNSYILDDEYWRDIGTPQSYLQAHMDYLGGVIRGFDHGDGAASDVATMANVDYRSVIGDGCVVKPNAEIRNSVIGPGAHVEERCVIENSVIWSHTRIATSATVRDAIIGRSCYIGRNSIISPGVVLGDKGSIPDYSKI